MRKIYRYILLVFVFILFLIFLLALYVRSNCFYIIRISGGLGNQFFSVFLAEILKQESHKKICFLESRSGLREKHEIFFLDKYNYTTHKFLPFNSLPIFKLFGYKKNNEYNFKFDDNSLLKEILEKDHRQRYIFTGLEFSEKYFKKYKTAIKNQLSLKVPLDRKNRKMLNEIKKYRNSVSIHVRRGDYLKKNNKNIYHELTINYYNEAIKVFDNIDDVHFFIFSNDIDWVKKNLKLNKPTTYVDINSEIEPYFELELMRNCKHNIVANSTFSAWAAYLNDNKNKIVVAPRRYIVDWPLKIYPQDSVEINKD